MRHKKRKRPKSKHSKLKKNAWDACSLYKRLKDAIDFCKLHEIDTRQFVEIEDIPVKCCTCEKILPWKKMDAGHWKGRGIGGGSGAYFDERNINTQCKTCNGFEGGKQKEHKRFILDKHGEDAVNEIEMMHRLGRKWSDGELIALEVHFKQMYNELVDSLND